MNRLDHIIQKVRQLPQHRQDEIADVVESMAKPVTEFTIEQREKIERGLSQADAGEFVPIKDVEAFFANFRDA